MSSDDHHPRSNPRIVFTYHDFRYFLLARLLVTIGWQMQSLAIGWQVYEITRKPLFLGLIGLVQFLPNALFALATGQVADRFDRRRITMICQGALTAYALVLATLMSWPGIASHLGWVYLVLFLIGTAHAFLSPASLSLLPLLVPEEDYTQAVTWNSSTWHFAAILGPSLGGILYWLCGPTAVYLTGGALTVGALVSMSLLRLRAGRMEARATSWATVLAGVRYVREQKALLGSISLDLFAVLLGGAVALLPVYASDILRVGPWGLGMLRGAPALGALLMALTVVHLPPLKRAGATMLWAVAGFGLVTVIFGFSRNFILSLACLLLLGAFDMISVIVRHTLVQVLTPKSMLGRVNAVNMVFIGASNELGEFESGVTAHLLGPVPAVVLGGLGTIAVVALWAWAFPALRRIDRLDKVRAEADPEEEQELEKVNC